MTFSVGEALRGFRIRQGLTLSDVARRSGNRFKISSLGAYERGDRAITVERLQQLADLYCVDVRALLSDRPTTVDPTIDLVALESRVGIVIDLTRFRVIVDPAANAVMQFGMAIKTMRKESSSSLLVVRRSDASLLAASLDCDPARIDDALRVKYELSNPGRDPSDRVGRGAEYAPS
jgi:transcriptional regulator with XRE-family HTH domain